MKFRNFVITNFPFLENDFDALTDYELFCKMMQYVIKVNADNKEIKIELEKLKEEIENLDLQEEVNNKLDEMASDGTLADIINQQIFDDLNSDIQANTDEINKLKKFNNYTNQPLKYGKLKYPSEFNHYNFNICRNYDGTITDDIDLSLYDTNNIVYVDRDNGNDANDGSAENPFKTIKGALSSISSLSENTYKIICKTYRFFRNEVWNEVVANQQYDMYKNIIIEPDDLSKRILISTDQSDLVWTSDGNGVYHTTRSSISRIYDLTDKNVYGMYKEVQKVESLSECQATSNTYYISGNTVYIHTKDGSTPTVDTYLIKLALSIIGFNVRANLYLKLKNIDIYPSAYVDFNNFSTNWENKLICENVNIFGCENNDGFHINNIKNVFLINCSTGYNLKDGFNYHFPSMPVSQIEKSILYENGCISFENGYNDTNTNNNCSTIHEGSNIIRANCVYQNSRGPVIADVDSSHTFMENCKINQNNEYNAFNFQNTSGVTTGKAYLIDCTSLQNNTLSLTGTDGFKIRLINFHGNYENSNLDIALWTE